MLPPRALLARLDDRMGMLTTGARDLPKRQQTLKNTLDWSFTLLSPSKRALFAHLGVFAGTFGLPAAEAICGDARCEDPVHAGSLIETLGSLVDSSLVRAEPQGAEPRFRLLDTIREYALQRLRETGDWTDAHDRHAAYFAALAEPAESELQGPGQLAWLERLETRACRYTARREKRGALVRRPSPWVTCWPRGASTGVPASYSSRPGASCGTPEAAS